jgi:hypothetical protein
MKTESIEQAIPLSNDAGNDNILPNIDALGEKWTTDESEKHGWEQAKRDGPAGDALRKWLRQ